MQPQHRLRGLRFSVGIAHSLSTAAAAAAAAAAVALAHEVDEVDSSFGRIVLRGHLRWAVHH